MPKRKNRLNKFGAGGSGEKINALEIPVIDTTPSLVLSVDENGYKEMSVEAAVADTTISMEEKIDIYTSDASIPESDNPTPAPEFTPKNTIIHSLEYARMLRIASFAKHDWPRWHRINN
jgi:hypothetical protein